MGAETRNPAYNFRVPYDAEAAIEALQNVQNFVIQTTQHIDEFPNDLRIRMTMSQSLHGR